MKRLLLLLVIAACVPYINKVLHPERNDKLTWYYEACLLDTVNPLKAYDDNYSLRKLYVEEVEGVEFEDHLNWY